MVLTGTFVLMRDGDWGLRIPTHWVFPGDRVVAVRRDGGRVPLVVAYRVGGGFDMETKAGWSLCTIRRTEEEIAIKQGLEWPPPEFYSIS